ncbi:MAG: hypothetical protein VB088_07970 [Sphaerochaeta sp.]|jgi:metal-responsive CopG/Arc/MetJ family transcriptional regulator|nr:hypothetical protein [Sphaerochaeta sp.]
METTKYSKETTQVTSVRMPKDILDRVDDIAKEKMWSRNKTIIFLLSKVESTEPRLEVSK